MAAIRAHGALLQGGPVWGFSRMNPLLQGRAATNENGGRSPRF